MRRIRALNRTMAVVLSFSMLAAASSPLISASGQREAGPAASMLEQAPPVPNISKFSTTGWDAGWYRMETGLQLGDSIYSFDYNTTGEEVNTQNPDDYRLATLPEYLWGSDYIVTRRTERREVFFMAERDIAVYAAIDTAYGDGFSWETGWSKTEDTLSTRDGTVYRLYRKTYSAGTQVRIRKLGSDADSARNFFLMILPQEGETVFNALPQSPVLPEEEPGPADHSNGQYQYYVYDMYNQERGDGLPAGYAVTGAATGDKAALSEMEQPQIEQGDLSQNAYFYSENAWSAGSPVDNNVDSYWESNGFPGSVTVDLGAAKAVNRLLLKVKAAWDDRTQTIEVKSSTNGQDFTTVVSKEEYTFRRDSGNTVEISFSTQVMRYLRLEVTANTGSACKGGQLGEIEVYGPDRSACQLEAGVNLARDCPFTVSSDKYQGQSPVDGDPTTYWRSSGVSGGKAETLTVDLERTLVVNRVDLRLWPRWGNRTQTLEIQGSEDGSVYIPLVAAQEYTFTEWDNAVSIPFTSTSLRYIRVVGTANTGDSGIQIGELEAYGPAQTSAYTGNRILRLERTGDGQSALVLSRELDASAGGRVVLESRVRFSSADMGAHLLSACDPQGESLVTLRQGDQGGVQVVTAHGVRELTDTCESDEWHTLRLVLDLSVGRAEVWVDHLRRAQDIAFSPAMLKKISYAIPAGSAGTLETDYLRVYDDTAIYALQEGFNELAAGSKPEDWQLTGSETAVAEVPFAGDKSLLVQDGEAVRTFSPIAGDVTVQVKVKPETEGWVTAPLVTDEEGHVAAKVAFYHNSIFISNGANWVYLCDQEIPHNYYAAGNWYIVKLVMNTDTRRYDVYVDGAKRYSGAAFAEEVQTVSCVRFAPEEGGGLYVDDLQVYDSASLARGLMPQENVFNVKDFGAVGDGVTDDTAAIARAIQAAAGTGGTVLLEDGVFYTGQLTLQSDMTLFIAPSATLYANMDRRAYNKVIPSDGYNGNRQLGRGIIYFEDAKNVHITGGGTIFGNGAYAYGENDPADQRPCILYFAHSQDVVIENLNLVQSPFWTVVPYESEQVTVRRVNITNHTAPNRDGIDPVNSQNITIEECCIFAGDDAICPKSGNQIPLENIEVRNCLLQSDCNGIKIGTDTQGPIRKLSFEDITIKKVGLSGITVQSVDGSDVENIRFSRIDMNDVDNALFVCIGNRYRLPVPSTGYSRKLGSIRDLTFEDIRFTNPMDHPYSQHGGDNLHEAMVIGLNPEYNTIEDGLEHRISDVLFKNVYLEMPGGATTQAAFTSGISNGYPEHDALKTSAGWAYTLRWTDNIRFVNCQSVAFKPDVRPEIAVADSTGDEDQAALLDVMREVLALQGNAAYPDAPKEVRQAVESALAAAWEVYEDNNAAAGDIHQAADALRTALDGLRAAVPVDKTALQQEVEGALTDLDGYTSATAAAYREALDSAKSVLADSQATQLEVNAALAALQTARERLEVNDPITAELTFTAANGVQTRLLYGTMFYTDWKPADNAPGNMAGTAANGSNRNMALLATVTFTPLHDGIDFTTAWKRIGFRLRSSWVDSSEKAAGFYYLTPDQVTLNENNSFDVVIPLSDIATENINWADVRDINIICELNDPYRYSAQQDSPDMTMTLANVRIAAMEKEDIPDVTALKDAIARAEGVDESLYTDETVGTLRRALEAAKAVLTDGEATQERVDGACRALEQALNRLELRPRPLGYGDVDSDGVVAAADALLVLQAATGKLDLSAAQQMAANVDGQPGVSSADALQILQFATRKITSFPVEG